jgi:hypothetical protein
MRSLAREHAVPALYVATWMEFERIGRAQIKAGLMTQRDFRAWVIRALDDPFASPRDPARPKEAQPSRRMT